VNSLILFEDEHLLAINKPSGINTHKPDRFAQDGIHEWLTKREPHWRNLSVLHRLDKDTSGVILFGKTQRANQSLAQQFESHRVVKLYVLLSTARPPRAQLRAQSEDAVTEFELARKQGDNFLVWARPVTGKTHQVRRHAAENGFPILGDAQYGGRPAPRLMLHAQSLAFAHPESGLTVTVEAPIPQTFTELDALVAAREFRSLLFDEQTNVFRLINGAADGFHDAQVDAYAGRLLVRWQSEEAANTQRAQLIDGLRSRWECNAIFEQFATKQTRTKPTIVWTRHDGGVAETAGSQPYPILENGMKFLARFDEGFSTGIFLDQRENRRRLLRMNLTDKTVLNCFAYTCAFSVVAARAGATLTSLDLSKSFLDWGRENFRVNRMDPDAHDFVYGDVFDWLKRFAKRGRTWDVVLLDPPTFSTTKKGRAFRAAQDYMALARQAIPLVARGGTLFCSTNQHALAAQKFESILRESVRHSGRMLAAVEYETQPFDFRVAMGERPYLKTFWLRLDEASK
jgi:23S rRNA (cytosine1962-C5)-methyltransferase